MNTHPSTPRPLAADWLVGGGEMGALIRAKDWSQTPLGAIEAWPQSLRSAVSILLPSKAQIVLFWGPEFVAIYNDAYRPVFGGKHPTALGVPARQCWSEVWNVLEPLFSRVVTTGEAFWGKDLLFALERHRYVEETYFDVSYDPVRDETGRVGGIFCIVSETTGRVLGERRLAALRDLGRVGIGAASTHDAFANAAAILARCSHDVPFAALYSAHLGHPVPQFEASTGLSDDDGVRLWSMLTEAAEAPIDLGDTDLVLVEPRHLVALPGGPWPEPTTEAALLRIAPPGSEPYGYLVAGINPRRRFDDDYGAFLRVLTSTLANAIAGVRALEHERRRAESLAELDRAKTTFFSNVSHEFRTPLTLILGPLEELLAKPAGTLALDQSALVTTAVHNGHRLLKLVNTLLDFARIEAGRSQASYEPTDLSGLTAALASNFRSACERAGLDLIVDCAPGSEPAFVDREMWEQIVLNLVSNAFKFTLAGQIVVGVRETDATFELLVSDTGTGIPPASLPRVFERFHRVEDTRGRSYEGSGIGLALVNELVKLQGGTISVESEVGRGTTFTVSLPKGREHLSRERVLVPRATSSGPSRTRAYVAEALGWLPPVDTVARPPRPAHAQRILVADDNADLREYARRLLDDDYEVETVADGQEAIEVARLRPPDLIVSDVMMPRVDGFELMRRLRADPSLTQIPVILLSARAGEEARLEGLEKGADGYLVKPFSSRELHVRVATLLASAAMHRRISDALTESMAAREALREADSRKDQFLATLAHELRNPLAPLTSALSLLKMSGGDAGPADAGPIEIMERQLGYLVRLVDDLMEMSRITRGNVELRKEPIALEASLRNAIEASEPLIQAGKHTLSLSLPDEPLFLDADPVRLAQIFGNLLNNAAKYSDTGGAISVTARREGDDAVVAISDTGDGIESDQIPLLFQAFVRGRRGASRNQSGLGIGLALVRQLVTMHGGRIDVESAGVGQGSQFTVRLPMTNTRPQSPVAIDAPAAADPDARRVKVLVVDDNRDAAESLQMLLSLHGADVDVAHNGRDALSVFAANRPRIVLLDIGMPGMDGYEVARRLRAAPTSPPVALIALTGWGQPQDRERARDAGFDHHLVKPIDFDALKGLIASIHAGRES